MYTVWVFTPGSALNYKAGTTLRFERALSRVAELVQQGTKFESIQVFKDLEDTALLTHTNGDLV